MNRGLTTAANTAANQEVVRRTVAVDLAFDAGMVRACAAPVSLFLFGQEYFGVSPLGSVSTVEETTELKASGLTLTLAGIPNDLVAQALVGGYRGRRAQVWEVLLDDNWQPIADPVLVFRGRMDQMQVTTGEACTVALQLENRLRDWERAPNILFSHEEQQREHAGDTFFAFVSDISQRQIKWGFRQ